MANCAIGPDNFITSRTPKWHPKWKPNGGINLGDDGCNREMVAGSALWANPSSYGFPYKNWPTTAGDGYKVGHLVMFVASQPPLITVVSVIISAISPTQSAYELT